MFDSLCTSCDNRLRLYGCVCVCFRADFIQLFCSHGRQQTIWTVAFRCVPLCYVRFFFFRIVYTAVNVCSYSWRIYALTPPICSFYTCSVCVYSLRLGTHAIVWHAISVSAFWHSLGLRLLFIHLILTFVVCYFLCFSFSFGIGSVLSWAFRQSQWL